MPRCPLCSSRPAKRFCPAKAEPICAVCCATLREIEIDCPSSCSYLIASREFTDDRPLDPELAARGRAFSPLFLREFGEVIGALCFGVVQEREGSAWLVDRDAVQVLEALNQTLKTLDSGIYYEAAPESPGLRPLYVRLKSMLDAMMSPEATQGYRILKVSEALRVIDFLLLSAAVQTNGRPRCRQFLDWISRGNEPESRRDAAASSRLILP